VSTPDDRARFLDLVRRQHQFPGDFHVSVITLSDEATFAALRAAIEEGVGPLGDDRYERTPSRAGKYTSHRFRVPCTTAEQVVELYERIARVKGVVSVL
jgi:putative lipoic acid-binding regulatory protein